MYFLIAGYNTMSHKQKGEYNIKKIATLFRNVMFTMAGIIVIGYIINLWARKPIVEGVTVMIAVLLCTPYLLIKANSEKYKTYSNEDSD